MIMIESESLRDSELENGRRRMVSFLFSFEFGRNVRFLAFSFCIAYMKSSFFF